MSTFTKGTLCVILLWWQLSWATSQPETCSGDSCRSSLFAIQGSAQYCLQNVGESNIRVLETLPGYGFDNLRNLDMAEVFDFSYTACKVTGDSQYLVPDNVFVIPQHSTSLAKFSEIIYDSSSYKSLTSSHINSGTTLNFGLFSISGSYSTEHQRVKTLQIKNSAATTRVQFRRPLYNVHLSSGMPLHREFKKRVYEIAANYASGQTDLADYFADLLVREYGTHFLTSIEVGGVLAKNDYIEFNYLNRSDTKNITSAASLNFSFDLFNFSFDYGSQNIEGSAAEYYRNRYASDIMNIGGPPLTNSLDFSSWINGIDNNLGIIDREGEPLSFAITPARFPKINEQIVRNVAEIIQNASDMYYKDNTRAGCTDRTSSAFNPQANYPNNQDCLNSTEPVSYLDVAFGGTYQTCYSTGRIAHLCDDLMLPSQNTLTGDYSCPTGYHDVLLYSGIQSRSSTYTTTEESCTFFIFFCDDETVYHSAVSTAHYELHWCAALSIPNESREKLYGGYYSALAFNPFTASRSCPSFYQSSSFGKDVKICTSSDLELGGPSAIKFGGFFSCTVGNPLVDGPNVTTDGSKWTRTCPAGYSQHLIIVEVGCEINICLQTGSYKSQELNLLPPSLPPYRIPQYDFNLSEPIAVPGFRNTILLKDYDGEWRLYNHSDPVIKAVIKEAKDARMQSSDAESSTDPTTSTDGLNMKNTGHSSSMAVTLVLTTWLTAILCF